jgi:sialate O-acetylesterase
MSLALFIPIQGVSSPMGTNNSKIAEIKPAPLFTNNMVLQQEKKAPVWGKGEPGLTVEVSFAGQKKEAAVGPDGSWRLILDPMEASAEGRDMVIRYDADPGSAITLENVLVGEVWLCSGQSNMEMGMSAIADRGRELRDTRYPEIRLFLISKNASPFPAEELPSIWLESTRENLVSGGWMGFSAVAFTFGRKLYTELKVPIGLIQSAYGGSAAYPWVPPEELESTPVLAANARALKAATLYNAMVYPLVPFAMRGVLWYQGEADVDNPAAYPETMKALISGWRRVFEQQDLPFYSVELAPWNYGSEGSLPRMWEAQEECLSIENTGMITTVDVGDPRDIHPTRKREVGERLALLALAKTYGRSGIEYSGPVYRSMKKEGDTLVISFAHAGSGLSSSDGRPLSWFTIEGANGEFVPAEAVIAGDTVRVRARQVKDPRCVRFAWSNTPSPNLANRAGLPAWPFRTDREEGRPSIRSLEALTHY